MRFTRIALFLLAAVTEDDVREIVERYAAYLERACLRTPYQWFNFFDFWA